MHRVKTRSDTTTFGAPPWAPSLLRNLSNLKESGVSRPRRLASLQPISPNGTRNGGSFFHSPTPDLGSHISPPEVALDNAQAEPRESMQEYLADSERRKEQLRSHRLELELKRIKLNCALAVMTVAETHADDRAVRARQEEEEAWEGFASSVGEGEGETAKEHAYR